MSTFTNIHDQYSTADHHISIRRIIFVASAGAYLVVLAQHQIFTRLQFSKKQQAMPCYLWCQKAALRGAGTKDAIKAAL